VFFLPLAARVTDSGPYTEKAGKISDHFDGTYYFNPDTPQAPPSPPGQAARWMWNWIFRTDRPKWPDKADFLPGAPPVTRAQEGSLFVTPVGHGTFLIQMDGVNILTDPIWSERCSPISWAGPKRKLEPGIRFEDLPPVDIVLVSHNHYDHLDLPTLRRLAKKGMPRAIVPLGNLQLVRSPGIPTVDELDWWQSTSLSSNLTITLVPAQHYSSRTLWDRNRSLWGGFVISGPSGNVFYSGDTGYGPHFQEIARRFSPIRVALLPIAPFKERGGESNQGYRHIIHMGPVDAVKAHVDLGTPFSIAAHYQVFQFGFDEFHDAVDALASSLKEHNLGPDSFVAPMFGQAINVPSAENTPMSMACEEPLIWWSSFGICQVQHGFGEIVLPLSDTLSARNHRSPELAVR
jgi:L-ascorbate metabolism protein UlaG (beta-lactamase superfamily)